MALAQKIINTTIIVGLIVVVVGVIGIKLKLALDNVRNRR